MSYTVTAPLVIVKDENGADQYLYAGATLPSHVKGDDLKRLKDDEMVVDSSQTEAAKIEAEAAGGSGGDGDEPPARSAPKAEWVDYAVSQGATREEAEASSKDDLIATYGG